MFLDIELWSVEFCFFSFWVVVGFLFIFLLGFFWFNFLVICILFWIGFCFVFCKIGFEGGKSLGKICLFFFDFLVFFKELIIFMFFFLWVNFFFVEYLNEVYWLDENGLGEIFFLLKILGFFREEFEFELFFFFKFFIL